MCICQHSNVQMHQCPTLNSNLERTLIHLDFCFYRQYLELLPGRLNYKGPEVLVEFIVSNTNMTTAREHTTRSEIRIVINLARQYTYHLSQSFFQSWLLGFLAYLTFWININDFTDRFMGSLTALLVLASLMSTLTESLPKTSYYKVSVYYTNF